MTDWKARLKALGPCPEAYRWAIKHKTLREAWRMCERADWMRWMVWNCEREQMQSDTYQMMLAIGRLGNTVLSNLAPSCFARFADREWDLCTAYMFLDFMPDPPRLPEIT